MSWSISLIGKVANVAKAIEEQSAALSGQCKVEFDAAKPHMMALVQQNFSDAGNGEIEPVVRLERLGERIRPR